MQYINYVMKKFRLALGIPLSELAFQLNLSPAYLSEMENNRKDYQKIYIKKVGENFKIDIETFYGVAKFEDKKEIDNFFMNVVIEGVKNVQENYKSS